MYIPRNLNKRLTQLLGWFPVVSVTGPRQSGKSTLLREAFPDFTYVNLEMPSMRASALDDPEGFIKDLPYPLIIDEAQHAPQLFSAIQVISDERGTPGQYILSGSQNFLLMKSITQSLAGRVGITHLLPLTLDELRDSRPDFPLDDFMFQGGYPGLHNREIPPATFFESYLQTYVERDVQQLLNVRDGESFRSFISVCAMNAGSLINFTGMANELNVSFQTVKNWVSILESSFITFPLMPYHSNRRKVLTKTPKLYFYDTGLLCYLLDIRTAQDLIGSPYAGAVMENFIISETAKRHYHSGLTPRLYFYRDAAKAEIDLLDFTGSHPRAFEIKKSRTFNPKFGRHLSTVGPELGIAPDDRFVIYRGDLEPKRKDYVVMNAESYLTTKPPVDGTP